MRRETFILLVGLMVAAPCGGLMTKTVNPGGGADYTSLNAAWASLPNPLVDDYKITCSGSTDDTTAAVLDVRTLDGHTVVIEGDNTSGKPDETKYQIHLGSTATGITDSCGSVTIRYIEVVSNGSPYGYYGIYVAAANVKVEKCIVHGFKRAGNNAGLCFYTGSSGGYAWNNVSYDNNNGMYIYQSGVKAVHNTFVSNTQYGISINRDAGMAATVKNNLISGSTTADYYVANSGGTLTTTCNYTSDATSPDGAGYQSKTFTFVNAGANDYHLAASQDGLYDCTNPGADGPTDDVDGTPRVHFDGGFDELVAAWSKKLKHHGALLCAQNGRRA